MCGGGLYVWVFKKTPVNTGLSCSSNSKQLACNAGHQDLIPGSGREWQSTPVFLPGESHGQRRLAGYSL